MAKFGDTATVFREIQGIRAVKVGEKFDVEFTCDSAEKEGVTFTYASNLIAGLETQFADGTLTLIDGNRCNWLRKLDVRVKAKVNVRRLDRLVMDGASNVDCTDTIPGTQLEILHNSVGYLRLLGRFGNIYGQSTNTGRTVLAGKGGVLSWSTENGSDLDARDLRAEDVYFFHYTARDCYLQGRLIMDIKVYGRGNVYYQNPPLNRFVKEERGEGRIIDY